MFCVKVLALNNGGDADCLFVLPLYSITTAATCLGQRPPGPYDIANNNNSHFGTALFIICNKMELFTFAIAMLLQLDNKSFL